MSLLAMPFLIINYGGEMIYILEQRLHSQQIKAEKAQKVLHDLTRALFNETFINELLRPQPLYTPEQTRDVCDKLAQSSIMKLSTDSMDKLFDLVVMGVKYQVMLVRHPCELIDITLNHIDYIACLGRQSSTTTETMDKARSAFTNFAKELRASEYAQVRQALLDFSIRKRVKVSLFLQEKMQYHDGRFVIPAGGPLPNEACVQTPGTITNEDGSSESFPYPVAHLLEPKLCGDPYSPDTRDSILGQNFYTIDRKKTAAPSDKSPAPPQRHGESGSALQAAQGSFSAGTAELNALGSLLGVTERPAGHYFKVSLFGEAQDSGSPASASPSNTEMIDIPKMTREDLEKYNQELCKVIEGIDVAQAGDGGPSDLSDLLDLAGGK